MTDLIVLPDADPSAEVCDLAYQVQVLIDEHGFEEVLLAMGMQRRADNRWVRPFVPVERECHADDCQIVFMAQRPDNIYHSLLCCRRQLKRTGPVRKIKSHNQAQGSR